MIVLTVFLLILNRMEFHVVQKIEKKTFTTIIINSMYGYGGAMNGYGGAISRREWNLILDRLAPRSPRINLDSIKCYFIDSK